MAGLCGSAIIEVIGEMFLSGVCDENGVIEGSLADRTPRVQPDGRTFRYVLREAGPGITELAITQNDVRQIQLAGAALRAGIDLLLEHAGIDTVHDIRLAGAFGAHIDPLYALVLGLVPDCPIAGVTAVGNAAGAGAIRMLVSAGQRREIADAVATIEKIETALEPRFQELFVAAMAFPHRDAPSPHLAALVDLPLRRGGDGEPRRRRRRGSSDAARPPQ
ncbi:MAG: ASKHA domain-containing protein [Acidimicrobiales bacterium]